MRRRLTAAEALRHVAATIVNAGDIRYGLCYELFMIPDHDFGFGDSNGGDVYVPYDEYLRAYNSIAEHIPGDYGYYLAPRGTAVEERAMFALLIAEQLDDEDRARLTARQEAA